MNCFCFKFFFLNFLTKIRILAIVSFFLWLVFLFPLFWERPSKPLTAPPSLPSIKKSEKVTSFTLFKGPRKTSSSLDNLAFQVKKLSTYNRPDTPATFSQVFLYLSDTQTTFLADLNTPYYLMYDETTQKHRLSPDKTPLSFLITQTPSELHIVWTREQKDQGIDSKELALVPINPQVDKIQVHDPLSSPSSIDLHSIKYLGIDEFLKEHSEQNPTLFILETKTGGKEEQFFLKKNEFLIYKDNQWTKPSGYSFAEVILTITKIDPKGIELTVFGPLNAWSIKKFVPQTALREWDKCFEHISLISMRGKEFASIRLEEHITSIEKGDWLLYQNHTWEKLDTAQKVQQYVHKEVKGNLLVIDDLVSSTEGSYVTSHLFSEDRSQKTVLKFPLLKRAIKL